ncbi:MAG: hypothetical protein EA384_00780 [Spirochaetaceae bacterium]|nr:MAG: hypothetical protein EA384_00780 [Spirochaetaceae bacterium]
MQNVRVGTMDIDPRRNPAVLDTGSWSFADACRTIDSVPRQFLMRINALHDARPDCGSADGYACEQVQLFPGSFARSGGSRWLLAETRADGQRVLLELAATASAEPLTHRPHIRTLQDQTVMRVYPTDADTLHRYFATVDPEKGPRPLGGVPRVGIGVRHSVYIWPGALQAMHRGSFSANLIQNSVRELHLLSTLTEGRPSRENYLFSFGRIQEGHAGSTFEGLWVAGALAALAAPTLPRYGADADHIQVKRGAGGLDRARDYLNAARYYSFYTLDVSDILNYHAMWRFSCADAVSYLEEAIPDQQARRDILAHHARERWLFGQTYRLDESAIGRLVGKYWDALDAVEQMVAHLLALKEGTRFDLEISIDETPSEIPTFNAVTSEAELLFLMLEIRRRGIPVTHLAPNFGVEKGVDYRGPDGLEGLEKRLRRLYLLASEMGFFLDCHSGDDLSQATRRTVGRATSGRIHFKVSPSLQVLYAETLYDVYPERFEWWWNDTIAWVRREAEAGSSFAADCLRAYERSDNPRPHPNHALFEHYNFASVGRRDASGAFENREQFYGLGTEFEREINRRVTDRLTTIAEDVFDHPPAY